MWSADPMESLRTFQISARSMVNTIFTIILRHYLPFSLCRHLYYDTKAMVGKIAGALTEIMAVIPNCTSRHCILHCHILTGDIKESFIYEYTQSNSNFFYFIDSEPLITCLLKILSDKMHKTFLLHTKHNGCLK